MSSRFSRPGAPRTPVAPVHRGPQALPPGVQQYGYNTQAPNAALLIDFDNVTMGIREDMKAELRNLLSSDIIRGKVSVQRAYADWRRYPGYVVPLAEASIDMIMAPAYGSAKKNATDIRLAVDAMELVFTRPEIGTFILLSGDSDFSSLVTKLKEYGKYVIGVGIRESASDLLVQNCDEYYSYNALAGLVKSGEEEVRRWDPYELVAEAVQRMARNGDVMRADRLKQVMQDIDASFDEKDLGMAKFSRFVSEAEHRGLLAVTRLDSGQYEIAPGPKVVPARDAVAAIDDPDPETETERGERIDRGRRRGRGRGRGRELEREPSRFPRPDEGELDVDGVPPAKLTLEAVEAEPEGRPIAAPAIGQSGERLTRAEAFDLVRRAVESLAPTPDDAVSPRTAREQAFALLGRDSESLGDRMFERILRDAADAGLLTLRRTGDAIELSRVVQSAGNVADQLNRASAATQAAVGPSEITAAGARSGGLGPRGLSRGRGPRGAGGPPPELLLLGAVQTAAPAITQASPLAGAGTLSLDELAVPAPVGAIDSGPPGDGDVGQDETPQPAAVVTSPVAADPAPLPRGGLRGRGRGRGGRPGAPLAPEMLLTGAVVPVPVVPAPVVPAPVVPVVSLATPSAAPSDPAPPIEGAPPADLSAPSRSPGRGRSRGRGGARKSAPAKQPAVPAKQPAAPAKQPSAARKSAAAPRPPAPAREPAPAPASAAKSARPAAAKRGARKTAAKRAE